MLRVNISASERLARACEEHRIGCRIVTSIAPLECLEMARSLGPRLTAVLYRADVPAIAGFSITALSRFSAEYLSRRLSLRGKQLWS